MNACEPRRQGAGTAILMAVVGALTAVTLWGLHGERLFAVNVVTAIVGWALLPLLARRPVATTIMLNVLAALSPAATPAATVGTLQVAQRRPLGTAVRVGLVGIAAHAVRGLLQPTPALPYGWWLVLVVIAHAALVAWGALTQARAALIGTLRERADRAEAEQGRRVAEARALERHRIAREMHDVLAHRLSLLATYAGALEYRPDAPPEKLAHAAGVIRSGVHQALTELRDVLTVLREDDTDDFAQGAQPVLADLPRLLAEAREAGTPVELTDGTTEPGSLPATLSRTGYRVVQEGLTNARKHAPGRTVRVTLGGAPGERLTIVLANPVLANPVPANPVPANPVPANPVLDGPVLDGPVLAGFRARSIPGSGTGLIGLTERVRLAGGRIDHRVVQGEFLLEAWLPFPACSP